MLDKAQRVKIFCDVVRVMYHKDKELMSSVMQRAPDADEALISVYEADLANAKESGNDYNEVLLLTTRMSQFLSIVVCEVILQQSLPEAVANLLHTTMLAHFNLIAVDVRSMSKHAS